MFYSFTCNLLRIIFFYFQLLLLTSLLIVFVRQKRRATEKLRQLNESLSQLRTMENEFENAQKKYGCIFVSFALQHICQWTSGWTMNALNVLQRMVVRVWPRWKCWGNSSTKHINGTYDITMDFVLAIVSGPYMTGLYHVFSLKEYCLTMLPIFGNKTNLFYVFIVAFDYLYS